MRKSKAAEYIVYFIVGAILVTAMTLLFTVNAKSRTREAVLFDNRAYEAAEQEYKECVQEILNVYGCTNSGLTMTRIVSLDGERSYCMEIHNQKLEKLEGSEFMNLYNEIKACSVVSPDGTQYSVELRF